MTIADGFHAAQITRSSKAPQAYPDLGSAAAQKVIRYHMSIPGFERTPLRALKHLSARLGVKGFYVKDESFRLGLNAFKALGAGYAMGRWAGDKLGIADEDLTFDRLVRDDANKRLGHITFVCATDGNHGRGVAWMASLMGQDCVVYLPKGTAPQRLASIQACGARAEILKMNYDECVALAAENAEKYGWVLIQDTAFEGYEEIPAWIMQGYLTMAGEAIEQLQDTVPTHVFLQAGVGSMAGAASALIAEHYGDKKPLIIIVEPNKADCICRTALRGSLQTVGGDMDTIMAGLACGRPNPAAWEVLSHTADYAVSCPDWVAAYGMRLLGNPLADDPRVISGESGAVTAGLASALAQREDLAWLKSLLRLDSDSVILCFSTEGDTDQESYRRIVWEGQYPNACPDSAGAPRRA